MQATIQYINKELQAYYPEKEVQSLVRLIIEHVCQLSYTEYMLRKYETLDSLKKEKIVAIIERLKKFEPIQYILGETEFYGMRLKVTPAVLIPRPETEELVQRVLKLNQLSRPSILDIGTGSGCIALALKNHIKDADVSALDISKKALDVARTNAFMQNLKVNFHKANILEFENYVWEKYDTIVSNPPYVRELEKISMKKNVLQYEPANALFVPNNDPLIFYKRIGEFSGRYLKKNGLLFVEINESFGEDLRTMFQEYGFVKNELAKDIHGKYRFLKCTKQ